MRKRDRRTKKYRRRADSYARKIVRLREDSVGQSLKPALLVQQESFERQSRIIEYGLMLARAYAGMPKIEALYWRV